VTAPRGPTIEVFAGPISGPLRVGNAFVSQRRTLTTTFTYDPDWYTTPGGCWEISPDLLLSSRTSVAGLPGALADSAPDRWGRNLVRKRLIAVARDAGQKGRDVTEVDFLLGVSDFTRQGALRYKTAASNEFLSDNTEVPKLMSLPSVLQASDQVARDNDDMAAIKLLLEAGSGSLGGARPKASVLDDGNLLIAKFPHHSDEWDVMAWEMTALDLAQACGITTPGRRLVDVAGRHVLLLDRFDRQGSERIGYISAMTLLGAHDGESHDYVELAEAIPDTGSSVTNDLEQLWRRIAFSLAINNTDDHLRNHGFLRQRFGWALSPVFDVNPNPNPGARRSTTIGGYDTDRGRELDAHKQLAPDFGLKPTQADDIWQQVIAGVSRWREVATSHGISTHEQRLFENSFRTLA
jgi:serine/threonine-protein kinase HipA